MKCVIEWFNKVITDTWLILLGLWSAWKIINLKGA